MSLGKFEPQHIHELFAELGAQDKECVLAKQHATRFKDLSDAVGEQSIKNLFFFLRDQIFQQQQSVSNKARANRLLTSALFELGVFTRSEDLAEVETKADEEVTTLDVDVNKLLGIDLEAEYYSQTVHKVTQMTRDNSIRAALEKNKLSITNVTWEDTSRTYGSAVGRNISDLALAVEVKDTVNNETRYDRLPVIRTQNFSDRTAEIDPENFMVNVGNAQGKPLEAVSLKKILEEPWTLMTDPTLWPLKDGEGKNLGLYADGVDKNALVSAQASFLPITKKSGKATYKPTLFNYQSFYHDTDGPQPFVLTIMVTREGVSMDIAGRDTKDRYSGQSLWFNANGERAPLTAKRPDAVEKQEMKEMKEAGLTAQDNANQHNRVLIIQVPLTPKHLSRWKTTKIGESFDGTIACGAVFYDSFTYNSSTKSLTTSLVASASAGAAPQYMFSGTAEVEYSRGLPASDVEDAVVSHGEVDGKYDEEMGSGWTRDVTAPVRITVQLTKATSNGAITEAQIDEIATELEDVYINATRVGSLVTG